MYDIVNCDIVYCWVWGEHPQVRDLFAAAGQPMYPSRSHSRHFLQNSIRLVRQNMPWHQGRIVVVSTCGLAPPGLDLERHRVAVVNQDDIVPAAHQPACNNLVVESHLHRLPQLTETFLYMNDDQFVLRYVPPEVWVDQRRLVFYRSPVTTMEELRMRQQEHTVWRRMSVHTAYLAEAEWGTPLSAIGLLQHMPYTMHRPTLARVADAFWPHIDAMGRRHAARSDQDVVVLILHQEWFRHHESAHVHWRSGSPALYCFVPVVPRNQERIAECLWGEVSILALSECADLDRGFTLRKVQQLLAERAAAE